MKISSGRFLLTVCLGFLPQISHASTDENAPEGSPPSENSDSSEKDCDETKTTFIEERGISEILQWYHYKKRRQKKKKASEEKTTQEIISLEERLWWFYH